jgi:nudix-type nucleoside diphosphatase (YffH/AdpP family)
MSRPNSRVPDGGNDRVRILRQEVLSDDWARLTRYTITWRRRDGRREEQLRQVYDRGDGAAILPYDPERGTVLLVRQFRIPVYLNQRPGHDRDGMLIEACAGLLDANDPETAIRKEAEEELGYRLADIRLVFDAYMSPGSVSEHLALFVARYAPGDRISAGGGDESEGEDIEILEPTLDEALAMVERGEIGDAKTIMLIQHLKLHGLGA